MYKGTVREVETSYSKDDACGLRVRAELQCDKAKSTLDIPWAFPLLPKTIQSVPKVGECVFVLLDNLNDVNSQRYYIGPIISQPQYFSWCEKEDATTLLKNSERKPLTSINQSPDTVGSFPQAKDVALIGRGQEDVTLKSDESTNTSEVDIRAGIRYPTYDKTNTDIHGNVVFNEVDPAYIQVKRKNNWSKEGNSMVNIVANAINIMSNRDDEISDNLHDRSTLVNENAIDEGVIDKLHQVPKGDELVKLLELMKNCILTHVHPWPGIPTCGDNGGYLEELKNCDMSKILSEHVRVS